MEKIKVSYKLADWRLALRLNRVASIPMPSILALKSANSRAYRAIFRVGPRYRVLVAGVSLWLYVRKSRNKRFWAYLNAASFGHVKREVMGGFSPYSVSGGIASSNGPLFKRADVQGLTGVVRRLNPESLKAQKWANRGKRALRRTLGVAIGELKPCFGPVLVRKARHREEFSVLSELFRKSGLMESDGLPCGIDEKPIESFLVVQ